MNFVSVIMLAFSILGALDRIIGNRFGLGKEFEKGFMLLGNIALSMIGMIVISPFIAKALAPCFDWVYNALRIDPSIIPASLFANDMGGASLAKEIAKDSRIGMFNALIVSSMMGCTISYSIPYALGTVGKENHRELFSGMLCGIVTVPVGCFVAGLMLQIPVLHILLNLLPLIVFSGLIACGLTFLPKLTVKIFSLIGTFMKIIITLGLMLGIFEFVTGIQVVEAFADVGEGVDICFNAIVILSGAFPLMYVVSKILSKPMQKLGAAMHVNGVSTMGFISSVVTNATTFEMMERMDKKGVFLNAAFAVSASFVFSSHLAFTMAFDNDYILAMMVAKLISGFCALGLAIIMYPRLCKQEESTVVAVSE